MPQGNSYGHYDVETGYNYNYQRTYDPAIGRYLEADPIGIQEGMNHLYVYVQNNPVNNVDLLGLEGEYWGECMYGSGGYGSLGGAAIDCILRTVCRDDGTYEEGLVSGAFGGLQVGPMPAAFVSFDVTLDRRPPSDYPELIDLQGIATYTGYSVALPWWGWSYGYLQLGMGYAHGKGRQKGLDLGFDYMQGYVVLQKCNKICCNAM